jgi:hypothetical protein
MVARSHVALRGGSFNVLASNGEALEELVYQHRDIEPRGLTRGWALLGFFTTDLGTIYALPLTEAEAIKIHKQVSDHRAPVLSGQPVYVTLRTRPERTRTVRIYLAAGVNAGGGNSGNLR